MMLGIRWSRGGDESEGTDPQLVHGRLRNRATVKVGPAPNVLRESRARHAQGTALPPSTAPRRQPPPPDSLLWECGRNEDVEAKGGGAPRASIGWRLAGRRGTRGAEHPVRSVSRAYAAVINILWATAASTACEK